MNYYLAEACQNTFIVFDCLDRREVSPTFLKKAHACLMKENRDDALILVDGSLSGHAFQARMLVLGQDGTLGEFCGNGARACAAYLEAHCSTLHRHLVTPYGTHRLMSHQEGIYSIQLPPVCWKYNRKFIPYPEALPKDSVYAEILEPHLLLNSIMSDEELFKIGRTLNQRKDLFPLGINVNAWHEVDPGILFVKTYERGVQRLTKSCGTGSISCAAFYQSQGCVVVQTPGGSLEIEIAKDTIVLKGPACCGDLL